MKHCIKNQNLTKIMKLKTFPCVVALTTAVLYEERHPFQLEPEALEWSAHGGPTHSPIQIPGYRPVMLLLYVITASHSS